MILALSADAPAEPSTLSSAVPNWGEGGTIHLGKRTLRVISKRDDDADSTTGAGRGGGFVNAGRLLLSLARRDGRQSPVEPLGI